MKCHGHSKDIKANRMRFIAQVSNDVSPRGPWQIKQNQCSHHDVSYCFKSELREATVCHAFKDISLEDRKKG